MLAALCGVVLASQIHTNHPQNADVCSVAVVVAKLFSHFFREGCSQERWHAVLLANREERAMLVVELAAAVRDTTRWELVVIRGRSFASVVQELLQLPFLQHSRAELCEVQTV